MFKVAQAQPFSFTTFSEEKPHKSSTNKIPKTKYNGGMDVDENDQENPFGEGSSGSIGRRHIVSPGEVITSSKEYMRGHGTYVQEEQVVSSVTGTIEKVNKLISVKPLKARYNPEVGDLVIGRIVEVGASRWKVDASARQDAVLMLSSVNLPGGVQRRKMESDALKMREFLAEGDLLVAEVQAFFQDGAMSLHTRSLKYGKLRNGHLLILPPRLIRRLKSHFHHIPPPAGPTGVDIILGLNGYVWVSAGTGAEKREGGEGFDAEGVYSNLNDDIPPESRTAINLVANMIKLFATHNVPLSDTLLTDGHAWLIKNDVQGSIITLGVAEALLADLVGVNTMEESPLDT